MWVTQLQYVSLPLKRNELENIQTMLATNVQAVMCPGHAPKRIVRPSEVYGRHLRTSDEAAWHGPHR